jgi:hypothetical protein
MADAYLPVWVHDLPAEFVFEASGRLRGGVEHYRRLGVVRVIAGPTECDLQVDLRRPYFRPFRAVTDAPVEGAHHG